MCYALPGPRCSNHCFKDLSKARTAFLDAADRIKTDPHTREKFEAAKARFERAQARFDRSPEGQRLLRDEAESIRATDPERAAALEALADKGEQVHAKEVGASKKAALAEQRAFLDLQRKSNEAWEEARKVSEQVSEQATPEERARLDELDGRAHAFLNQSFTTPLGLKIIKDDLRLARQEYAAATTDEDRARAEKAVRFHAAHLAESKKKRERMIVESKARDSVRAQADRIMAEERAKDGLKPLDEDEQADRDERASLIKEAEADGSAEALDQIARQRGMMPQELALIASSVKARPETLKYIARNHHDSRVLGVAVKSPRMPRETLIATAQDTRDANVVRHAAANPALTRDDCVALARYNHDPIDVGLAENPNTPASTLHRIAAKTYTPSPAYGSDQVDGPENPVPTGGAERAMAALRRRGVDVTQYLPRNDPDFTQVLDQHDRDLEQNEWIPIEQRRGGQLSRRLQALIGSNS